MHNQSFDIAAARLLRLSASASVAVLAACLPTFAAAQATAKSDNGARLEEVIVTAQKREQSLQDVPVAVSAVTAETLKANRIATIRDLGSMAPNLVVKNQFGGGTLAVFTMRGSYASTNVIGADRGVAYYIDGVFIGAASGGAFEFSDLQRIEILRGPQGTLFGRNSTAGAVSVYTGDPSDKFGVRETLTGGNYGQFQTTTTLNTGAHDGWSAKLTFSHNQRQGDIRNSAAGVTWDFTPAYGGTPTKFTSPKRMGDTNTDAAMAAVKFEPSDNFKAIYKFDYVDGHLTAEGVGLAFAQSSILALFAGQPNPALVPQIALKRPDVVNNGNVVPGTQRAWGHNLTMQLKASDSISVKNILAYRHSSFSQFFNDAATGVGLLINTGSPAFVNALGAALAQSTIGSPYVVRTNSVTGSDSQLSDELQVNYDSKFVTLTSGALFYRNAQTRGGAGVDGLQVRSVSNSVFPGYMVPFAGQPAGGGGRITRVTTKSYAAYSQGEFHVLPRLDFVAGIRYTMDRKTGIDYAAFSPVQPLSIFNVDYKDNEVTYNLGLNYKVSSDLFIYGKRSTGYISGGETGGSVWDPERAKSWEAGVKGDWLDGSLRTNLALFQVDYASLQFSVSGLAVTPRRPDVSTLLLSAGAARAKGFELETTYRPIRPLTLSAGVGYTDFKFKSLSPAVTNGTAEFRPALRPKWTTNLAAQYKSDPIFNDVTLTARADANWRSKAYAASPVPLTSATFTAANQAVFKDVTTLRGYWIANARVSLDGFTIGGVEGSIALWSRNILNTKSAINFLSLGTIVGAHYERARTVGVDLTVDF